MTFLISVRAWNELMELAAEAWKEHRENGN